MPHFTSTMQKLGSLYAFDTEYYGVSEKNHESLAEQINLLGNALGMRESHDLTLSTIRDFVEKNPITSSTTAEPVILSTEKTVIGNIEEQLSILRLTAHDRSRQALMAMLDRNFSKGIHTLLKRSVDDAHQDADLTNNFFETILESLLSSNGHFQSTWLSWDSENIGQLLNRVVYASSTTIFKNQKKWHIPDQEELDGFLKRIANCLAETIDSIVTLHLRPNEPMLINLMWLNDIQAGWEDLQIIKRKLGFSSDLPRAIQQQEVHQEQPKRSPLENMKNDLLAIDNQYDATNKKHRIPPITALKNAQNTIQNEHELHKKINNIRDTLPIPLLEKLRRYFGFKKETTLEKLLSTWLETYKSYAEPLTPKISTSRFSLFTCCRRKKPASAQHESISMNVIQSAGVTPSSLQHHL